MLIALVVLTALLVLGTYTAVIVRKGISQIAHDRHEQTALYAAESGIAAGLQFLRTHYDPATYWSAHVTPDNEPPGSPNGIAGAGAKPETAENPFGPDARAWYEVTVHNNLGDPGFSTGDDTDARVYLRSIGHGPDQSVVVLEVEVTPADVTSAGGRPCPGYAQRSIASDGAGRNDCLETVEADVSTYEPESQL